MLDLVLKDQREDARARVLTSLANWAEQIQEEAHAGRETGLLLPLVLPREWADRAKGD